MVKAFRCRDKPLATCLARYLLLASEAADGTAQICVDRFGYVTYATYLEVNTPPNRRSRLSPRSPRILIADQDCPSSDGCRTLSFRASSLPLHLGGSGSWLARAVIGQHNGHRYMSWGLKSTWYATKTFFSRACWDTPWMRTSF